MAFLATNRSCSWYKAETETRQLCHCADRALDDAVSSSIDLYRLIPRILPTWWDDKRLKLWSRYPQAWYWWKIVLSWWYWKTLSSCFITNWPWWMHDGIFCCQVEEFRALISLHVPTRESLMTVGIRHFDADWYNCLDGSEVVLNRLSWSSLCFISNTSQPESESEPGLSWISLYSHISSLAVSTFQHVFNQFTRGAIRFSDLDDHRYAKRHLRLTVDNRHLHSLRLRWHSNSWALIQGQEPAVQSNCLKCGLTMTILSSGEEKMKLEVPD